LIESTESVNGMLDTLAAWLGLRQRAAPIPGVAAAAPAAGEAEFRAHYEAGLQHLAAGRCAEAEASLQAAIELKHDAAEAHYQLGLALMRLGRADEAADSLVMATCFAPQMSPAHYTLAVLERAQGRSAAALKSVERALEADDGNAQAHNLKGALLLEAGDVDGALASFEGALARDLDNAAAHANLGYVLLRDRGDLERGGRHIEQALQLDPANTANQCNYTMLLSHRGELQRALELADRLLAADPNLHEARLNRALCLLKLGRFQTAWDDYEARKLVRCNYVPRDFGIPDWHGVELAHERLLVFGEQGLGDEIMFASCYRDLLARVPNTTIECSPRLKTLFQRSFPDAVVYAAGEPEANAVQADFCVAAGSLPRLFRRSGTHFPAHDGYLRPDPIKQAAWRSRLDALGSGLKVGLSWRGGTASTRTHTRSVPPALLAPLLDLPGTRFVDLQYGDTALERAQLCGSGGTLHRWQQAIEDLDETAALISSLDLVISVCTTVVHLAGALGRDVWVMVPVCPEWRYLDQGERIPWYPSVRLLRQQESGWTAVLEQIRGALCERLRAASC
jgi:tetratricopeptide (TPR) repeat protein